MQMCFHRRARLTWTGAYLACFVLLVIASGCEKSSPKPSSDAYARLTESTAGGEWLVALSAAQERSVSELAEVFLRSSTTHTTIEYVRKTGGLYPSLVVNEADGSRQPVETILDIIRTLSDSREQHTAGELTSQEALKSATALLRIGDWLWDGKDLDRQKDATIASLAGAAFSGVESLVDAVLNDLPEDEKDTWRDVRAAAKEQRTRIEKWLF